MVKAFHLHISGKGLLNVSHPLLPSPNPIILPPLFPSKIWTCFGFASFPLANNLLASCTSSGVPFPKAHEFAR